MSILIVGDQVLVTIGYALTCSAVTEPCATLASFAEVYWASNLALLFTDDRFVFWRVDFCVLLAGSIKPQLPLFNLTGVDLSAQVDCFQGPLALGVLVPVEYCQE